MKTPITLLVLGLLLAAAGCAVKHEPLPGERIGTLGVSGTNVFLNGRQARGGEPVKVDDTITTGAGSSGMIEFTDGGIFQLDENTDPIFVVKRLQAGFCILARIFSGQAYVDKQEFCIETPALDAINHSRINILITPQQTGLTVFEGSVDVSRPQAIRLLPSQRITMTPLGEDVRVRTLSRQELAESIGWRNSYAFSGYCCRDYQVSPSPQGQCSPQDFSFDRELLESRCRPPDQPRFRFNIFGRPGYDRRSPAQPSAPSSVGTSDAPYVK